jgi:hypothetical protein
VLSPEVRTRCAIVNHPSHPVTLRADQTKISAEFAGVLYRELGAGSELPGHLYARSLRRHGSNNLGRHAGNEGVRAQNVDEAQRSPTTAKPLRLDSLDYRSQQVVVTFVST